MTTTNIADKIQKLLSLAGNNPSEEEAKAALLKAQELMAKYNIEQAQLNPEGEKYTYDFIDSRVKDRSIHCSLGSVIATSFACRVLRSSGYIYIFGRKDNAQAAVSALKFAFKAMRRGAHAEIRAEGLDPEGPGVAPIYNSYCKGFIAGIKAAMDEQCVSLAIVVPQDVNDALNSRFNLRTSRKATIRTSTDVKHFSNGFQSGKSTMARRTLSS